MTQPPLRVAVLVDLPRSAQSGGHVKGWEYRAKAVARSSLPLDLTLYFSGPEKTETLAPHVRLRQLPPVFSTARLAFLPYVPDHTDLAPYHPALARELKNYDLIHTTDAYFAFSRTAEKVACKHDIPLVTSFHTDTPAYARVFARKAILDLLGEGWLSRLLIDRLRLPERQQEKMLRKLKSHVSKCTDALLVREEDRRLSEAILGPAHTHFLRPVVDKGVFHPRAGAREALCQNHNIPTGRFICLFAGRLDEGKNIYTLIDAVAAMLAQGQAVHLVAAGLGPAAATLREKLGENVTVPGFVPPERLGALMAGSDLFTLPSEIELRSFTVVEALASGLPVVVAARSGIAELMRPAREALHQVEGGAAAWETTLTELLNDPARHRAMKDAALLYADEHILSFEDAMRLDFLPVWEQSARLAKSSG